MAFPRIAAVVFLIFLIGSLSLFCIGLIAMHQQAVSVASGQFNIESTEGKIVAIGSIGSEMDFVLKTAAGHNLHFRCASSCHASMGHLQRHLYEQATTYVYYVEEPDKTLMALNVD